MKRHTTYALAALAALAMATPAQAGNFKELVGDVKVGDVKKLDTYDAPFLTWGGDVATFHANGGATTTPDSHFGKLGVKLRCVNGDDFVGQVKKYLAGETPLLRGTVRMIGIAAEVLNQDPRTKPVMFMQLTWSAGDHMVARRGVKTLNDLKGKKIALQQGGPHVGMLDDILHAARLKWSDVTIVWCKDLTGTPDSPAEKFRSDTSIDAALCISPDMVSLCGGLQQKGTGQDKTVKDSRVLVSTAQMSRSIADVYCVRKDFFDANKEWIQKFVSGYLKGCEDIVRLKGDFEKTGSNADYLKILKLSQTMFGKEVIPVPEADGHGLISDCSYVGLPGNVAFFKDEGNLAGFAAKTESALKLATEQGYASKKGEILNAMLDYDAVKSAGSLTAKKEVKRVERFAEMDADDLFPDDVEARKKAADKVILNFTVSFQPNQSEFTVAEYKEQFHRAVESATTFGNAAFAIGGHADPTKMISLLVKSGMTKGTIKRTGTSGNYSYTYKGKPLDLKDTDMVLKLVRSGEFKTDSAAEDPGAILKALEDLSQKRADAVKKAILDYAKAEGHPMDPSQLKTVGVGPREPIVAKPTNKKEYLKNMRVEFRLVKVAPEAVKKSDFDF